MIYLRDAGCCSTAVPAPGSLFRVFGRLLDIQNNSNNLFLPKTPVAANSMVIPFDGMRSDYFREAILMLVKVFEDIQYLLYLDTAYEHHAIPIVDHASRNSES